MQREAVVDPYTLDVARWRVEQLRHEAAVAGLARLVECCRPSTWRRAARALLARTRPAPARCGA